MAADAPPRFDDRGLRSSRCDVAGVARTAEGVELRFGVHEARSHCPDAIGVALAHRVRLDLAAARNLEEVLTRVLGDSIR